MVKRANKACRFFPCHRGIEDCTFCYCPFYPCQNQERGNYIYSPKLKKDIWSCQECNWIHKKKVVDSIFDLIRKNFRPQHTDLQKPCKHAARTGIIILGHGSKLSKANKLLVEIAKIVRKRRKYDVIEASFLQFHHPDLSKSIEKLIRKGCKKIVIVPFFLFKGNHVKRDIPLVIKKAIARHADTKFVFTKSLGEDAMISDIVFRNIDEGIEKCV